MPISIPTNIAGISIPSDLANGPLAALYGNKYKKMDLKYPRDLGSNPSRNHVIKFSAWKKEPADLVQIQNAVNELGRVFTATGSNIEAARNAANEPVGRARGVAVQVSDSLGPIINGLAGVGRTVLSGSGKKTCLKDIFLYVPDTLNVNYSTTYDDISITESLGKALFIAQAGVSIADLFSSGMKGESLQNLGNKIVSDPVFRYFGLNFIGNKLGMQNLGDLGLQGINKAINPQLQVLFRGIGFRTFQFDFILTPYNQKEAQDIKDIIHAFKYHSAPEITKAAGPANQGTVSSIDYDATGLTTSASSVIGSPFFNIPETFTIEFMYNGKTNENVNRIAECVLTSVNVDYAPNGHWATHTEGAPVQTRLSLQFQEIEVIDKTKIREGY